MPGADEEKDTTPLAAETSSEEVQQRRQQKEHVIRKHLSAGFRALRKHRELGPSNTTVLRLKELTPDYLSYALVHFIDPLSASGGISSHGGTPTGNSLGGEKIELYPRLISIFSKQYDSRIHQVPYKHFRSGHGSTIESLPVKTYVTKSALLLNTDPAPFDTENSDGFLAGDPSEWHTTPYCHVYLAACESLEQYRTKIKPSIQAFVSQIESSNTSSASSTTSPSANIPSSSKHDPSSSSGGGSSQYVIVFIPTGDHTSNDDAGAGGGLGSRLGWRVAAAGRRIARETSSASDNANTASNEGSSDDVDAAVSDALTSSGSSSTGTGNISLTSQLSKIDKEIARRFNYDFPTGKVCTLSTLYHDKPKGGLSQEQHKELQRCEWREFLKSLGAAIGDGFRDRCRKYDDEIRQQDQLRAASAFASSATSSSDVEAIKMRLQMNRAKQKFDLVYFFLIKESFAFTYEQMMLPSEALLQYDELRAVLPDVSSDDGTISINQDEELSQIAIRGDCVGFRRRLRSMEGDLTPIAPIIQQYLLARETLLLFKMNNAVVAAERCLSFVKSTYDYKKDQLTEIGIDFDDKDKSKIVEVEAFAFEFCWDVYSACNIYLSDEVTESQYHGTGGDPSSKNDEALARCICDLLEFARLRLVEIGDLVLDDNPIRSRLEVVNRILYKDWKPWKPGTLIEDESFHEEDYEPDSRDDFVQDAIRSSEAYLTRYLELLKVMVSFNRFSGRTRCAARLAIEVAGIYCVKGNPERATYMLREAAQVYGKDRWQTCQFMLLFRLAAYQREVSTADDYIETLVNCFSPAHVDSAPKKALAFLLSDLESVIHSSLVSRTRLTSKPIFDPILGMDGQKISERSGSARDLLKKVYSVGDTASVTMVLTSYLPKEIEIEEISIDLVPFRIYIAAMEDSTACKDEDVYHSLRKTGPLKISTGLNELTFDWVPMMSGQFIISSTTIKWKGVRFYYLAKDQKRPTIRIDVLPAEPTHSIQLTPDYIVPGHEQAIKLSFRSGLDIVKEGNIKFSCTDGLQISLPGSTEMDEWSAACESPLPSCNPSDLKEVTILLKPKDDDCSKSGPQFLRASVSTLYRCQYPDGKEVKAAENDGDDYTEHTLELQVCTLEKNILTIERTELISYALDRAVMDVSLQCNSPASIVVKNWTISLPPFIIISKNGDMNNCLSETPINPGEEIFMSFDFMYTENDSNTGLGSSPNDSFLVVEVESDFGHTFKECLPLGLKQPTKHSVTLPKDNLRTVKVEVKPSVKEGPAGIPIKLQYKMDTRDLFATLSTLLSDGHAGRICYQVSSACSTDWVVSGRTEGLVVPDAQPFILDLLAIPARPGVLDHYPSVSLYYSQGGAPGDTSSGSSETLPLEVVELVSSDFFQSEAPSSYTSVAVPMQMAAKHNRSSFVAR